MNEIIATLSALSPHLNRRTLNQLAIIVEAVLAMTGRVTMLGLSHWAEKGRSYRTVQRFFLAKKSRGQHCAGNSSAMMKVCLLHPLHWQVLRTLLRST